MKTLFKNAYVITLDENDYCFYGDVVVEDNLIIYAGESYKDKCDKVIDCTGKILIPGFINTHCHSAMSLFRNLGENTTFKDWWQDVMRPMEECLKPKDYRLGVTLSVLEMLKNGITTCVDMYMQPQITAEVMSKYGMRGMVAVGAITGNEVLDEAYLTKEINSIKYPNISPILYAHSIYSCDESQIAELVKYAVKYNLPLTTHVSETLGEVGNCYNKYGVTPVGYLESLGFFDNTKTILAHCVHCDKDDVNILKNYDVSIATNPSSNLILGSGIAPIFSFVNNDINICIGTDGAGSNNSLDMFKEMFLMDNLQAGVLNQSKALTTYQTLKSATLNGAKALGVSNLGQIKRGYLADVVLVDTNVPNMQPLNDNITALVNSANVGNIYLTMVNGRVLYENGNYTFDVDFTKLFKEINQSISDIKGIAF